MTTLEKQSILERRQRGEPYSQIADALSISVNTVKAFCRRNSETSAGEDKSVCKHCGKPLIQLPKMKQRSFCGDACRVAWWNTHRNLPGRGASQRKVCPHCGREFVSYGKNGKTFCGHPCFIAHRFARGGVTSDAGAV